MEFELLRTREQILALRDEWDELWARSHGDYYTGHASCLLSWDEIHAPLGRMLRCAVLRQAGRLAAVLPMATYRKGLWTIAVTLGPDAAEGCDIVQDQDAPAELGLALLRFFLRHAGADILDLPFVRGGNALDKAVLACGAYHVVAQVDTMPYARLRGEGSWADYERSLSRQTQAQTARKRRRLAETGAIAIAAIEGPADAAIDWLLMEKAKWGRKVAKTGQWLFAPAYRAYLKGLAADPGRDLRLVTFVLSVDGKPAAVKVIALGPQLATLIIAAYDEDLGRFSPGNILDEVWVRHVFDKGCGTVGGRIDINFGNGVERYKLHWGRGCTYETHTYKVAATRWGELPYRAKAASAALARFRATVRPVQPTGADVEQVG